MKRKSIKFIAVFLVIIMLPQITWPIVSKISVFKNISNSTEQQFPVLTITTYQTYTDQLEAYVNDKMPYKDFLVTLNGMIDYFVFGDTSSESVVIGDEGWLFYKDSIADYEKTNLYSEEELYKICANLSEIDTYFKEKGVEFVLFIAPNKATLYGETFLPKYIEAGKENCSRIEQVIEYVRKNTDIKIVYPKEEMKTAYESNPDELLFFKRDTHWNNLGAYYGAKVLLEEFGVHLPDREKLQIQEIEKPTYQWNKYDLVNMLGLTNILTTDTNYNISGYLRNDIFYSQDVGTDREAFATFWKTTSTSNDSRKMTFIRDSFGGAMLPYVANSFAEVYSPHLAYVSLDMICEEKPDIVVIEIVERSDISQISLTAWDG